MIKDILIRNQSNRSVTASANKNKEEGMEKENKIIKGGSNYSNRVKRPVKELNEDRKPRKGKSNRGSRTL